MKPESSLFIWVLTTLLAVLGVAVLIRLGLWQLDRLEERRAFNRRVLGRTRRSNEPTW